MKKLLLIAALLIATIAIADRTDTWLASTIAITKVELAPLPDGGCTVTAYGSYSNNLGKVVYEGTATTEVAGANRTTCLDILNNKAPVLFKTDKGL